MNIFKGSGFYYHYKHDASKGVQDYAYEVLNVGHHTEIDGLDESRMIVYRPLYESAGVYKAGKHWDVRPYDMFIEKVVKEEKEMDRFTKIEDLAIIAELEKVRDRMYS